MKKLLLAGAAVAVIAGSTAVYAQHRPWMHHHVRINPEDRAAFADARIAAVKAGLKLTPDQEKMWPAVETSVRDFAKLRIDRAKARMEERKAREGASNDTPPNPVERLQKRADNMAATAGAMKKIAEAADPLYKTLDDGQKRRLAVLTHMGPRSGEGGWHYRGPRPPGFGPGGFERGSFEGPGFSRPGFDNGDRRHGGPGFGQDDPPDAERL
ncbi:hypothetical protein RPMA_09530 [Tardiphaga alba]|uniref:LTXXQ motif family protein n=1 Tax=Tardiphaga alba TaxID=340268 RepID=A0ABX8A5P6_9BRAD|nr:Spy/CpxP family protein refolding chaperone [Tardiphaga alba]QUS39046.1 hypothetical protein RPMA_09530 [Tardiphaga alba]